MMWCSPPAAADCPEHLQRCPTNQTVALGNTVTLYCELTETAIDEGIQLSWVITVEGITYRVCQPTCGEHENIKKVGQWNFTLKDNGEKSDNGHGTNLTLSAAATTENNNSNISCRIEHLPRYPYTDHIDTTLTAVGELLEATITKLVLKSCIKAKITS